VSGHDKLKLKLEDAENHDGVKGKNPFCGVFVTTVGFKVVAFQPKTNFNRMPIRSRSHKLLRRNKKTIPISTFY